MIYDNCDVSLILPAYNEAETIGGTLIDIAEYFGKRGWKYEIIVAADGEDQTRERAREFADRGYPVTVIGQPGRHGKGKGIRDAVKLARGAIIGFVDADNKVPIQEYDKLDPWIGAGYDVVIGSRALARSVIERAQPWYRRIGSRGFYYFMRAVVGMRAIEDTQCGFKFFQHRAAKELFGLQQIDGYMFDVEILLLAQSLGYRIKEQAIRWHDDGDSRLRLFSGNVRNAVDILRIRFAVRRMGNCISAVRARAVAE